MHSKQVIKWGALVLLLVSMSVTAIPGTADEPQAEPSAITCGDVADCTLPGPAVEVINRGAGAAIRGRSRSARIGVLGIGQPGVRGTSGNGTGVEAHSTNGYAVHATSDSFRGAYLRSGSDSVPDLVLGGNSSSSDNGTIFSEPTDPDSDLVFFGNDKVHVHLDEDNNTAGANFRVYNGANDVILDLADNGELYIADDLHLDTDGGFGEIYATGASNSRLYLYSNSWIDVHLDDNDDEPQTCFNIFGSPGLLWQQCESKGTTAVGSQAVAVETSSGSREMYTIGSPGLWFEDFGSAALVGGQATVTIDPLFAETVNLDAEYQVYLTPVSSEAVLLFVTEKTPTAFTVQGVTLDGSPAFANFDYRIVAKRLGYEDQRLEQVNLAPNEEGEP